MPKPQDLIGNFYLSDVGLGGSLWRSNGEDVCPVGGQVVLVDKKVASAQLTGVTTEQLADEFLIQGKLLGKNGGLVIFNRIRTTNNGNSKTLRFRVGATGGLSGTAINDPVLSGSTTITCSTVLDNAGSVSSQIGSNGNPLGSNSSNDYRTASVNTDQHWFLSISGQVSNAADFIQIVSTRIMLVRGF